jgi:hypothetical protein
MNRLHRRHVSQEEIDYWCDFFIQALQTTRDEEKKVRAAQREAEKQPHCTFRAMCIVHNQDLEKKPFSQVMQYLTSTPSLCNQPVVLMAKMEWKRYRDMMWTRTKAWRDSCANSAGEGAMHELLDKLTLPQCFTHHLWSQPGCDSSTRSFVVLCPDPYKIKNGREPEELKMIQEEEKREEEIAQSNIRAIREFVKEQATMAHFHIQTYEHNRQDDIAARSLSRFHARIEGCFKTLSVDDGYRPRVPREMEKKYDEAFEHDLLEWRESIEHSNMNQDEMLQAMRNAHESFTELLQKNEDTAHGIFSNPKGIKAYSNYHFYAFMGDWHYTCAEMIKEWQETAEAKGIAIAPSWPGTQHLHAQEVARFRHLKEQAAIALDQWQADRWTHGIEHDHLARVRYMTNAAIQVLASSSSAWKEELLKIGDSMASQAKTHTNMQTLLVKSEKDRSASCREQAENLKPMFNRSLATLLAEVHVALEKLRNFTAQRISVEMIRSSSTPDFILKTTRHMAALENRLVDPTPRLRALIERAETLVKQLSVDQQYDQQWLLNQPLTTIRVAIDSPTMLTVTQYWHLLPFIMQLVAAVSLHESPQNPFVRNFM